MKRNIIRDPWSHQDIIGWIVEYIFQLISGSSYLFISMIFASFFISVCLVLNAFCKQFRALLDDLQYDNFEDLKRKKTTKLLLYKLIDFHTTTKEWVIWLHYIHNERWNLLKLTYRIIRRTVNLFSSFLLIHLVGGVVHISACVFQLDMV